jgi:hypothetical protein
LCVFLSSTKFDLQLLFSISETSKKSFRFNLLNSNGVREVKNYIGLKLNKYASIRINKLILLFSLMPLGNWSHWIETLVSENFIHKIDKVSNKKQNKTTSRKILYVHWALRWTGLWSNISGLRLSLRYKYITQGRRLWSRYILFDRGQRLTMHRHSKPSDLSWAAEN